MDKYHIWVDYAGIAVCAVIALLFSFAVTGGVPKFVSNSTVTDWMQGIGTLIAAGVAIRAYTAWRRPEDARRVADAAQLVIRESKKLETLTQNTRGLAYVLDDGPRTIEKKIQQLRDIINVSRSDDRAGLLLAIEAFELHGAEVEGLFNESVRQAFKLFQETCHGLLIAYGFAPSFYNPDMAKSREQDFDDILNVIGLRGTVNHEGHITVDDPYGERLLANGDALRKLMHPRLIEPSQKS